MHLANIPQLVKKFRQAILAQAVTGKLTEKWREGKELEDMNEFVKRLSKQREEEYIKSVAYAKANKLKKPKKDYEFEFERHPTRGSWCVAKLENLIYMSARIGWKGLKADEYTEEGPMFLSVHGLNYGENVNYDVAYHITQERYDESPEIMLQENDILLCKDGAGIGKLGIVKDLNEPATVNSSLLVVRGREALNYKYLYYFMAGPSLQNIAKERISGTAIPHLFQRDIKEFSLEIPSLEEQDEIVLRVESLFTKTDAIEAKYINLKAQIDNLPQAILVKAFKGELVEQLSTDGEAKDFLEEIKVLKAAVASKKKTKKKVKPKSKPKAEKVITNLKAKVSARPSIKATIKVAESEVVGGHHIWLTLRSQFDSSKFTLDEVKLPPRYSYQRLIDEVFNLLDFSQLKTKGPRLVQVEEKGETRFQIKE